MVESALAQVCAEVSSAVRICLAVALSATT